MNYIIILTFKIKMLYSKKLARNCSQILIQELEIIFLVDVFLINGNN